jgi:hypothetical protein
MYILLFFFLAPVIAGFLLTRAMRRARSESQKRRSIIAIALGALALWIGASGLMLMIDFGMAMSLAHSQTYSRSRSFPEGWFIYVMTAAYAGLGCGLFALIGRLPRANTVA